MSAETIKVERLENGQVSVHKGTKSDMFPEER